jgi:hypothetical protein
LEASVQAIGGKGIFTKEKVSRRLIFILLLDHKPCHRQVGGLFERVLPISYRLSVC